MRAEEKTVLGTKFKGTNIKEEDIDDEWKTSGIVILTYSGLSSAGESMMEYVLYLAFYSKVTSKSPPDSPKHIHSLYFVLCTYLLLKANKWDFIEQMKAKVLHII